MVLAVLRQPLWNAGDKLNYRPKREHLEAIIQTLEGDMIANHGDYIIKGIEGEIYPCKASIFENSYDKVSSD